MGSRVFRGLVPLRGHPGWYWMLGYTVQRQDKSWIARIFFDGPRDVSPHPEATWVAGGWEMEGYGRTDHGARLALSRRFQEGLGGA